jgi:hypothetical protein
MADKDKPELIFHPAGWDYDDIFTAVNGLVSEVHDIAFHHTADGTWQPWPEGDPASLLVQGRGLIDQLDAAVKKARRDVAVVERAARLRGYSARRRTSSTPTGHTTPDGGTQP